MEPFANLFHATDFHPPVCGFAFRQERRIRPTNPEYNESQVEQGE